MDILKNLNERQKEAVTAPDGPLLVIAGAGSGKTLVLTSRIAHLIRERGVPAENILAVTFTNKAAREMKERVQKIAGPGAARLNIGTFHSICLNIIRKHGELCGLGKKFVIFDEKDQEKVVKDIISKLELDEKRFPPGLFLSHISSLKSRLKKAGEYAEEAADGFPKMLARVFDEYESRLKENNAIDFDDMIARCVFLFESNPEALTRYQDKFRHILIDEYQDTNRAQYQFVKLISQKHKNLCVVGDSDQAIYSWRQADIANILNFEKDYPEARVVLLEENYRSTQNILETANQVIKKNKARKEKNLFTRGERGEKVKVVLAADEKREAEYVALQISRLVSSGECVPAECAALFRTNAQSRALEEALIKRGIPYVMLGGFKFYERKEIKDIISYLRYLHNEKDSVSLERIINAPPRGIGAVAQRNFFEKGKKTPAIEKFFGMIDRLREEETGKPLSQLIKIITRQSGLEEHYKNGGPEGENRWENVLELCGFADEYGAGEETLANFLEKTALVGEEEASAGANAVRLMTMHSAKGLEFSAVFVLGMEDNIFPHARSKNSPSELEEERRLCYVALTRAKKYLFLLYAQKRKIFGQTQANPPSRFLFDLPEHLVAFEEYGLNEALKDLDWEDGVIEIG